MKINITWIEGERLIPDILASLRRVLPSNIKPKHNSFMQGGIHYHKVYFKVPLDKNTISE